MAAAEELRVRRQWSARLGRGGGPLRLASLVVLAAPEPAGSESVGTLRLAGRWRDRLKQRSESAARDSVRSLRLAGR